VKSTSILRNKTYHFNVLSLPIRRCATNELSLSIGKSHFASIESQMSQHLRKKTNESISEQNVAFLKKAAMQNEASYIFALLLMLHKCMTKSVCSALS